MDNINEEISFVGTGKLGGKNVEINFKTKNAQMKIDGYVNPKIIIDPLLNQENLTYVQIKTINDENTSDNPSQINGEYIVMFKKPTDMRFRNEVKYHTFEGACENFVPTGMCAFSNKNKQMLVVHYNDIVQLKPIID